IKLFVFPRMFAIPNLSPFCCKLETWLRIAKIPYTVMETADPRTAPRRKLPFIEDGGERIADSSVIVDHLSRKRAINLDEGLSPSQRATAVLVQRTLEEHYAFVLAYTHLLRDEGLRHTRARFDRIPAMVRPFVARAVHKNVSKLLWSQGILRGAHEEIIGAAIADWRAVLTFMSDGPFFFGERATSIDATVFGTLAPTVLTPIETPIQQFLRSEPKVLAYANRMRDSFFPELKTSLRSEPHPVAASVSA
ncbi:MAG TPA: glutathione S-transferase family protein, partial [Polyangiaceae bacterium]|nr:glutathione S-transferase family protein [Polyangiaceae bacterium]